MKEPNDFKELQKEIYLIKSNLDLLKYLVEDLKKEDTNYKAVLKNIKKNIYEINNFTYKSIETLQAEAFLNKSNINNILKNIKQIEVTVNHIEGNNLLQLGSTLNNKKLFAFFGILFALVVSAGFFDNFVSSIYSQQTNNEDVEEKIELLIDLLQ